MLDIFGIHHEAEALSGAGDPTNDFNAHKKFNGFYAKSKNFGLLTDEMELFDVCSSEVDNRIN